MEPTPGLPGPLAPFPNLVFRGDLRPSQREVVDLARAKLTSGSERRRYSWSLFIFSLKKRSFWRQSESKCL
jgi:hypothetical protein